MTHKNLNSNVDFNQLETISDLEEKEFDGISLNMLELKALRLFRELRLKTLSIQTKKESQFHNKYEYFRALSNTIDYKEFVNKKFDFTDI